ncbi:unnamed protein product [Amoebophrya sp. A120]|nr:unnamed protein product [Amoebophrya sp. A120]|eukprot:GSA120T00023494001.1
MASSSSSSSHHLRASFAKEARVRELLASPFRNPRHAVDVAFKAFHDLGLSGDHFLFKRVSLYFLSVSLEEKKRTKPFLAYKTLPTSYGITPLQAIKNTQCTARDWCLLFTIFVKAHVCDRELLQFFKDEVFCKKQAEAATESTRDLEVQSAEDHSFSTASSTSSLHRRPTSSSLEQLTELAHGLQRFLKPAARRGRDHCAAGTSIPGSTVNFAEAEELTAETGEDDHAPDQEFGFRELTVIGGYYSLYAPEETQVFAEIDRRLAETGAEVSTFALSELCRAYARAGFFKANLGSTGSTTSGKSRTEVETTTPDVLSKTKSNEIETAANFFAAQRKLLPQKTEKATTMLEKLVASELPKKLEQDACSVEDLSHFCWFFSKQKQIMEEEEGSLEAVAGSTPSAHGRTSTQEATKTTTSHSPSTIKTQRFILQNQLADTCLRQIKQRPQSFLANLDALANVVFFCAERKLHWNAVVRWALQELPGGGRSTTSIKMLKSTSTASKKPSANMKIASTTLLKFLQAASLVKYPHLGFWQFVSRQFMERLRLERMGTEDPMSSTSGAFITAPGPHFISHSSSLISREEAVLIMRCYTKAKMRSAALFRSLAMHLVLLASSSSLQAGAARPSGGRPSGGQNQFSSRMPASMNTQQKMLSFYEAMTILQGSEKLETALPKSVVDLLPKSFGSTTKDRIAVDAMKRARLV